MRKQRGDGEQDGVRRAVRLGVALGVLAVLHGCGGGSQGQSGDRGGRPAPDSLAARAPAGQAAGVTPLPPGSSVDPGPKAIVTTARVLFIGTSLTAGYGLDDPTDGWPGQLARIADSIGYNVRVQNAGLSGETSAGALRRADWILRDTADVVVIETGANDGLRGLSVDDLRRNLRGIVDKVRARQPAAEVVVVQMQAPPNLGGAYADRFGQVFSAVAKETGATLTPFLLDGVAGVPAMNQADGIHPTEQGAARAARVVWPSIRAVLDRVQAARPKV
ncbi:MAG TPA: arylesterase [Gemmatimonadaceae bacterium]|nr:arylesterase [Gemmatimonadaceae bacterium]